MTLLPGGLLRDTLRPLRPLSIPNSILPGDFFSSATICFRGGDTGICREDEDFKIKFPGSSFSTSEVADAALAFLCCSFFNFNRASIASKRNCRVSSSSSSSTSLTTGVGYVSRMRPRFGVVADFLRGEREGDVRSLNWRSRLRPLGEAKMASCGDRGGQFTSQVLLDIIERS